MPQKQNRLQSLRDATAKEVSSSANYLAAGVCLAIGRCGQSRICGAYRCHTAEGGMPSCESPLKVHRYQNSLFWLWRACSL